MTAPTDRAPDEPRTYLLLGPDGPYRSTAPGLYGGNRRGRIYGRLDCPAALRALARGGYRRNRVFFADEPAAVATGYRPCGTCLPRENRSWRVRLSSAEPGARDDGPIRSAARQ